MRLFHAFANMWRGFVSLFIRDLAVANPEMAYEGIIQQRKEERASLIAAAGAVVAERNKRAAELANAEQQLADAERKLAAAVRLNDKEVGALLVQQKANLERQRDTLRPQVEQLNTHVESVKQDIARYNRELLALQQEAKVNIARLRSAQAQKRIMDMIEGLSVRGDDQMLSSIRDSVEQHVGQVEVMKEIDESGNLERRLEKVSKDAEKNVADDEFARLRASFEGSQGVQEAKTPASDGNASPGKQA